LGAPPTPRFGVSEARFANPGRKNAPRKREGVCVLEIVRPGMEDSESAEKQENTGIGPASACRGESAFTRVCRQPVMRGLDPRIHLLRKKCLRRRMDCRVKPGNDSGVSICSICAVPSKRNQQVYEMTARAISLFPDCYLQ